MMIFEEGYIYHIYNQGNNRQRVFFSKENYLYFLHKIRRHILPHCDILAYCIMPNHFHLMVLVNHLEIVITESGQFSEINDQRQLRKRTLNQSIGIMLRSYTNALNKQRNTSGSVFRKETKAECVNCPEGLAPSFIMQNGTTVIDNREPEREYPQICFNYIHQNPVNANLVERMEDWEFSSARDYSGLRNGTLVAKEIAKKYFKF